MKLEREKEERVHTRSRVGKEDEVGIEELSVLHDTDIRVVRGGKLEDVTTACGRMNKGERER